MSAARVADFYVLIEPRGSFNKAAVVAVRQSRPGTSSRQIAVRIRLTIPKEAFDGWVPVVDAEIEARQVVPPTIEIAEPEEAA